LLFNRSNSNQLTDQEEHQDLEQMTLKGEAAEFIWRMEDLLELYGEPYDERRPLVCFAEHPYQA